MKVRTSATVPMLACALSCGGVELRGGRAVATGDEPGGKVLGRWVPSDCRDARGAASGRPTRLFLVAPSSGKPVLVEVRDGYDSVVVDNAFTDEQERVFQFVTQTDEGVLFLHDYRLPVQGEGAGRMAAATRWREVDRPEGGFRAYPEAPVVTCRLMPEATMAGPLPEG